MKRLRRSVAPAIDLAEDRTEVPEARDEIEEQDSGKRRPLGRLNRETVDAVFDEETIERGLVLQIEILFAFAHAKERRLRDEEVSLVDELAHLPIKEGEKQRPNVAPVDVGIGHQNDLVVPELR